MTSVHLTCIERLLINIPTQEAQCFKFFPPKGRKTQGAAAHHFFACIYGLQIIRVGQNRIHTPYMTVYLVIPLPQIPCIYTVHGSGQPYK